MKRKNRPTCTHHPTTPLPPSRIKRREYTGCWRCVKEYLQRTRPQRALRWRKEFIPCVRHPKRKCNKSYYVANAARRCAGCLNKNSKDEIIPSRTHWHKKWADSGEKAMWMKAYRQRPSTKKRQNRLARERYHKRKRESSEA